MKKSNSKIKYFAYIRRSQDRDDAQTLSIDAQKRTLKKFANQNNINIIKYFTESKSAYKVGRPQFNNMLNALENKEANGIVTYHLTRLARNSLDGGKLIYLMDEDVIQEIQTPEQNFKNNSDSKFLMNIHFGMAKKSSDDTSQFVKRDIKSKILKGEYPLSAPMGYLNLDKYGHITGLRYNTDTQNLLELTAKQENRALKRIEQDPNTAPLILKLYELYSTGQYSINDLRNESFKLGLKGQRSRKALSKATLSRILNNPLYYGAIHISNHSFEPEQLPEETRHDPIVSRDLFNKVQKIQGNSSKIRKKVHNHKYTGIIRCGECGGMITAEIQKGITYYRCTKKKNDKKGLTIKCSQKYITEKDLEMQIETTLQKYVIPEDFANWALKELNKNNDIKEKKYKSTLSQQKKRLTETEQQLTQLLKLKISPNNMNDELISNHVYLEQKNELEKEQQIWIKTIASTKNNHANWLEQCEEFFDFAVKCEEKWISNKKK